MPRLINLADQRNLWGTTATFEPQRSDLWLVDFTQAVKGVQSAMFSGDVPASTSFSIAPQFVQAVSLPEVKMKPEVFRRDSVPFNMPCWDEPLEAIKITFLIDTGNEPNQSNVLAFLQTWHSMVRAGRGDRSTLYNGNPPTLDANYRFDYSFPIRVVLLRGGLSDVGALSADQITELNTRMANEQTTAQQEALRGAMIQAAVGAALNRSVATQILKLTRRPLTQQPWLQVAGNWLFKDAWLAGWKLSDLSYGESKLATVETVFYAEDFYQAAI